MKKHTLYQPVWLVKIIKTKPRFQGEAQIKKKLKEVNF